MANNNPSSKRALTAHQRITRRVFPVVIVAFIAIGLLGMLSVRTSAYSNLDTTHSILLANMSRLLESELNRVVDEVARASRTDELRQFALAPVTTPQAITSRNELLAQFLRLLQQHPDTFAAVRYISINGSVRLEVINTLDSTRISNVAPGSYTNDQTFMAALEAAPGEMVMSPLFLQTQIERQPLLEPRPILRLGVPVRFRDTATGALGVFQVDVLANSILDVVSSAHRTAAFVGQGRRFILENNQGQYLADNRTPSFSRLFGIIPGQDAGPVVPLPAENPDELSAFLRANPQTLSVVDHGGDIISARAFRPGISTPDAPWRLIVLDPAAVIFADNISLSATILIASLLLGAVVVVVLNTLMQRTLVPIDYAARLAEEMASSDHPVPTPLTYGEGGEMVVSMTRIAERIQDMNTRLENQRRRLTRNLEIAARVSRETAMLSDIDALLNRVVNLICDEYGYYHAQVFLLDDVHLYAVLAFSHGDPGRKLLEQGHRLQVGSQSVIGAVTAQGRPVVVNDTRRQEEQHHFNPILPHTRAEMALPLKIGDEVIGALDIQSANPNAFGDEEIQAFQLLADQVAIAVYNRRLLLQTHARVEQIDRLNRQLTRESWQDAENRLNLGGAYQYDLREVRPADGAEPHTNGSSGELVTVPIRIRGEVVGTMDVTLPEGDTFSEGDQQVLQAVTERVALALENARLFQETQLSLDETQALYELSSSIHEAENLQAVIAAIIRTIMPDASGGQVLEFDDHARGAAAQWLTITADWSAQPREWQQTTLLGMRLHVPDYEFLASLRDDRATAVEDIELDGRVDEALRIILRRLQASALVVVPLNMRGLWRATLMIQFPQPRPFSDRDLRIYDALIDQAGAAVDNRLLLQQTEATLELQERLYAASRTINTAETSADLVSALLSTASDARLGFALSLLEGDLDDDGWPRMEHVIARTVDGQVEEVAEIHPLHVSPDSPLHTREPEVVRDLYPDDPAESPLIERIRAHGQRFCAIFPLYSDNHPVALLYVTHPDLYELEAEDYEFYVATTGQISTVLQKRRLLEQTERALEETRLLYTASRAITTAQELTQVYEVATEFLANASDTLDRVSLLLTVPEADPSAAHLEYAYAWSRTSGHVNIGQQVTSSSVPYVRLVQEAGGMVLYRDAHRELAHDMHFALLAEAGVVSLVAVPLQFRQQWFGVLVCESAHPSAFDERYARFVQAIADQIAITIENRRLLLTAEEERQLLSSILETMPSGVIVLDPHTFVPLQVNAHAAELLGREIDMQSPFTAELYQLQRTGTQLLYNTAELPIYTAAIPGQRERPPADDIVIMREGEDRIDLLMNAAPIRDARGNITHIVAALEDITSLRGLENALQENLRETIAIYEATRALAEAEEVSDVLDTLIAQMTTLEPSEAAIYTLDEETGLFQMARLFYHTPDDFHLPPGLFTGTEAHFIDRVDSTKAFNKAVCTALAAQGIRSLALVPLWVRSRDIPTAWVVVAYTHPHDFTPEQERYLTTVADSAATVLDNRFLFVSTQNALQEASILYRASRALSNATSHEDILNAVIDHLIADNVTQVFMALLVTSTWDHPHAAAEVVASWNASEATLDLAGVSLSPAQFPAWGQLSTPQLVTIGDIHNAPQLDELERLGIESMGVRSVVIMPLRVGNRVIGCIWLGSPEPQRFTERDLRIYQSFSEQASLTMEASRLLEQTERRARQLATSAQVSQIASAILDLSELLPRMVNLIQESFGYDHVQVFLMDRDDEYAVLQASTGEAGRQLLSIGHKLAKGSASVIGQVTARAEPVLALDTGMADVVHRPNPYLPLTRSEMALPLIIKGSVVGALDVQSNTPNAFSDEDVQVLTTLAAQISVAIDNARLFEQAERRASDMSLLFTITTAAASAETLAGALQNVVEDLQDSLGARSVGLYLPVTYIDELTDETFIMLRAAAAAGISEPLESIADIRVGDPASLIGSAAASFRSVIVDRISAEAHYMPLCADSRSAIIVPLTSAAQLIGVMTLENTQDVAFNHESLTLLQTMGGSLSAIIQNAQLLETVQETNEQLRELDRIKSEFLASMSHELRTPLNSIIGFSRVILKGIDGPLTEMQEQDLTTIYSSGQHLLGLINDILDQAKIAAGKMDLKPDYFDIRPVVEGVRSIGIGLVKDKPINLRVEIQSGLPMVYGDEFRTRQVLLNLVSNATKFTQEGAITLSVYRYRDEKQARDMVRIDVADTGIGIAEKDMPVLFEAFRQVDSSLTRTAGGTGLGLPISKSLVEMQGGEMMVTSRVNEGSTFSLTLPLEPADGTRRPTSPLATTELDSISGEDEPVAVAEPAPGEAEDDDTLRFRKEDIQQALAAKERRVTRTMPVMSKRQILLIEDNTDRVDQYRRTLQREGFDVFTASIPLEAEAMASGLRPTLIIMDVNFADGAGWEILRKLKDRDDTFDIPIIIISLSGESERAYQLGAYTFLQHPILPDQLVEAVRDAENEGCTERILIIDDQPESTRLLMQLLDTYSSYRVFAASSGREGVSLVARRRPDLVILDLRMPEMDGFAVLQELRANPETASIPVMIVTGDTLNADEQNQLVNVGLMYKTDISLEDYQRFIHGVETHLARNGE